MSGFIISNDGYSIVPPPAKEVLWCAKTGGCGRPAVAIAHWKRGCKCGGTKAYCAGHRDRANAKQKLVCGHCKEPLTLDHMEPLTPYKIARAKYLASNSSLAAKDAMVAAVTLNDPAEWDTFGSLLPAGPAKPPARRHPALRKIPSLAIVMLVLFVGYVLGAVIGL